MKKAEVTEDGLALAEVNTPAMRSRSQAGPTVRAEVLDALGPSGGYNFLRAWATGRAAGPGAAARPQADR